MIIIASKSETHVLTKMAHGIGEWIFRCLLRGSSSLNGAGDPDPFNSLSPDSYRERQREPHLLIHAPNAAQLGLGQTAAKIQELHAVLPSE